MSDATYPLAPQGVFRTIQGEGSLLGTPMVFVRLAGCSVGCDGCDTDYSVASRATAREIAERVAAVGDKTRWVWITGGEPADHALGELVGELRRALFDVAVATSGAKSEARDGWGIRRKTGRDDGADFLSVSPHFPPGELTVWQGHQINLVPGLGRLNLADWRGPDNRFWAFPARWVTPFWCDRTERALRIRECEEFLAARPDFRLGVQAHKVWGVS
jgi:7-carboxy-7-deazaguanine synthase